MGKVRNALTACLVELELEWERGAGDALRFPAVRRSVADALASRVFRVPGGITIVCVGERVGQVLDEAGVRGITYVAVDWADG